MAERRLNVGCGRNILEGWINLDVMPLPGVDIVADLERCADAPLPIADNSIDEFLLSHLLEHIRAPLPMMQELHRVAKPEAMATIRVPHGASDDGSEDPTHVRLCFPGTFGYFGQPYYWRADYGYRGDWDVVRILLLVERAAYAGMDAKAIIEHIRTHRNVVREMICEMKAVKPIREPLRELQTQPKIEITFAN
ncbi:MAG TPA: methyltransferase domain-containing protein [bacterium]|nr:methyltransferase domain-containing protein [bacterium]